MVTHISRVTVAVDGKLCIEQRRYDIFMQKFKAELEGKQRLGQAFYDYFKLDRLNDQSKVANLYAKDGEQAKATILAIFDFT
jgi:uncharacterized protein YeaO (DUF488 family)